LLLEIAGLARSTYYYQLKSLEKPDKYKDLKDKIKQIFHKNKGRYGYRRIKSVFGKIKTKQYGS